MGGDVTWAGQRTLLEGGSGHVVIRSFERQPFQSAGYPNRRGVTTIDTLGYKILVPAGRD